MSTHKREQAGLGRSDIDDLVNARHGDPFAVLGPHPDGAGGQWIRAYLPDALSHLPGLVWDVLTTVIVLGLITRFDAA